MTVTVVQEIELFMNDTDKSNCTFFPKLVPPEASRGVTSYSFALVTIFARRFLHLIVPEGETRYQLFAANAFLHRLDTHGCTAGLVPVSIRAL